MTLFVTLSLLGKHKNMLALSFVLVDNLHRVYSNQIFKKVEEELHEKDAVSYETRTNII